MLGYLRTKDADVLVDYQQCLHRGYIERQGKEGNRLDVQVCHCQRDHAMNFGLELDDA